MDISWNVTPSEAIALQKKLREQIKLTPLKKPIKIIAGADVSMQRFSKNGFAGFIVLSYPDFKPLSESVVESPIPFPYIPGLLSFREIPMLILAWKKLLETLFVKNISKPDLIIVDGVGIAHPRRMGIATHLGLILGIPAIGCAKSVLTGVYDEPAQEKGAFSYIYDRFNKTEIIGAAIRTKPKLKPVFVSPGHLITLEESIEIVKNCVLKHRLPEPTRLAHNLVKSYSINSANL